MTMRLIPGFSQVARVPHCSICGQGPGKTQARNPMSEDRPVVDLDLSIDFEGSVEICLTCAAEAGALAGMISEQRAKTLTNENARLKRAVERAEKERDATMDVLDSLRLLHEAQTDDD